jgi:integrase
MKKRREHVVPLSSQSADILRATQEISGNDRFVFPSQWSPERPMSENTVTGALRRMGFSKDEMTAHGFRSTASTLLNECGRWPADAIERSLAHKDRDAVRGTYHRGAHWAERIAMAQWWSNHLDDLRNQKSPAT